MRDANDGARARFDRTRSAREYAMQVLAALGVTVIGISQLGPWGAQLREDAWRRASAVLPWSYSIVDAGPARTDPVESD